MKKLAVVGLVMVFAISMLIGPAFAKSTKATGSDDIGKETNKATVAEKANSAIEKAAGTAVEKVKDSIEKKITGSAAKSRFKTSAEQKAKISAALKKVSEVSDYTDTKTHWGSQSIKKAKALGLLKGYEDGSFKPDATLSTLEATVIAVRVAENLSSADATTESTSDTDTDTDVDTDATVPDWSKPSVDKAQALKIINVNRFHSQVQVTRAQAAIMLAKALKLEPVATTDLPFPDVATLGAEDLGYLLALQQAGVIHGSPDGKFNPNSSLTRAEIAAMLANIADQANTDPGTGATTGDTLTAN